MGSVRPDVDRLAAQRDIEGLAAALGHKAIDVRLAAVKALEEVSAAPALIAALGYLDGDVRTTAAESLGKIGDPAAVPALTAMLRDDRPGETRSVVWALAELAHRGEARALKALTRALFSSSWAIASAAAERLPYAAGADAVRPLIRALKHTEADVRIAAADALGEIADPVATLGLVRLLSDKPIVAVRAAAALGSIGDRQAVPALVAALRKKNPGIRIVAARALGEIGDERAVDALTALLEDPVYEWRGGPGMGSEHVDYPVRRAAAEALERMGHASCLQQAGAAEPGWGAKVVLLAPGPNRVAVMKIVREVAGVTLDEARRTLDETPSVVAANLGSERAHGVAARLRLVEAESAVEGD